MNINKKNLIIGASIFVLVVLCISLAWWGINLYKANKAAQNAVNKQKQQLMAMDLELGKAKTQFGNAQKEMKNLNEDVQKWIKDNNAQITDVAYWKGRYEAEVSGGKGDGIRLNISNPSGGLTNPANGTTINNYYGTGTVGVASGTFNEVAYVDSLGKKVWLDTNNDGKPDVETDKVVLNYKDFRLDAEVEALSNIWNYKLHQEFGGEFVKVITRDEKAPAHFMRIWEVGPGGQRLGEVKLTDFQVITQDETGGKSVNFWWNPKVDIGMNFSFSDSFNSRLNPELGFSISGRGKTKDDNDWRFFRVSLSKDGNDAVVNFAPVCWNAGKKIPVIQDLYMCPTIGKNGAETLFGFSVGNPF